jgi:hypothetical protein
VPRNDPADNGGLFIGRRPGSAPLKYRTTPERLGTRRQRADGLLAGLVFTVLVVVAASCWGPQPLAWLWIASHVSVSTGLFTGIAVAFFGLLASVMGTLWIAVRLDGLWRILRRAAGHDQKDGVLGTIFLWTAVVFGGGFLFWLVIIHGPGSTVLPSQ